jgi:hypothetical protein
MKRPIFAKFAAVVGVLLIIFLVMNWGRLTDIYTLLRGGTPAYARHVPANSLLVARWNVARLALKSDLRSEAGREELLALKEKALRFSAVTQELFDDPITATGIQLADDCYGFVVERDQEERGIGVLWGVKNKVTVEKFLRGLTEGTPVQHAAQFDFIMPGAGIAFAWNDEFGLIYTRTGFMEDSLRHDVEEIMTAQHSAEPRGTADNMHDVVGMFSPELIRDLLPQQMRTSVSIAQDVAAKEATLDFLKGRVVMELTLGADNTANLFDFSTETLPAGIHCSDSSLFFMKGSFVPEVLLKTVSSNYGDVASRENALHISAKDILLSLSGDFVLDVAGMNPWKDFSGRMWPIPQLQLEAGLKDPSHLRLVSSYLVSHQIAKSKKGYADIQFGDINQIGRAHV